MGGMKDQLGDRPYGDLFSGYPHTPGYAKNSDTSKAAAARIAGGAGKIRERIYKFVEGKPSTRDEIAEATGMRIQTVSARARELIMAERIAESAETRLTRAGSPAAVLVLRTSPAAILDQSRPPPKKHRAPKHDRIKPGTLDWDILSAIKVTASTMDAIEQRISRSHPAVSGNMRHLVERGYVVNSGFRSPTRSGSLASNWMLTDKGRKVFE